MQSIYLSRADYDRLVTALLDLSADPVTGKVEADAIKIALGEFGDVWPSSVQADSKATQSS